VAALGSSTPGTILQAPVRAVKVGPTYDGALTYICEVKAKSTQAEAGGVLHSGQTHRRQKPPALQ